jgi:hypothetical protein
LAAAAVGAGIVEAGRNQDSHGSRCQPWRTVTAMSTVVVDGEPRASGADEVLFRIF